MRIDAKEKEAVGAPSPIFLAAEDLRYLLNRGYPGDSAAVYVCDHYRLAKEQRFVLARVVCSESVAFSRRSRKAALPDIEEATIYLDGYNVIITVESLLAGYPVYLCDDGFCRDARGLFSGFRPSEGTDQALMDIFDLLANARPARVEVLLDRPMSKSGELAGCVRNMMAERGLPGGAEAVADVDRQLKIRGMAGGRAILASSDGYVIDRAARAIDIPGEMALLRGIALRGI